MTRVLRAAGPRATAGRAAGAVRVSVKGHVLVLPAVGAGPDPRRGAGPPQAQPRPRGRREGAAGRAVASPPAGAGSGPGRLRRTRSPTRAALRGVLATPGGRRQRHRRTGPAGRPGSAAPAVRVGAVQSDECELLSASYPDRPSGPTGPSPTAPCSTSWSTCSGRCPSPRSVEVSLFLDRRLRRVRGGHHDGPAGPGAGGSTRSPTAARHVRAHPGRRGAGHHADAVADAATARAERQLDDRRRPGPELLARRGRGRPGR